MAASRGCTSATAQGCAGYVGVCGAHRRGVWGAQGGAGGSQVGVRDDVLGRGLGVNQGGAGQRPWQGAWATAKRGKGQRSGKRGAHKRSPWQGSGAASWAGNVSGS